MSVTQTLSVTELAGSVDTTANTSKVRILWKSTQEGDSWNGFTRTAKYYVSINGGAETEYEVDYTLPKNTIKTIVDVTLTVAHKSNGAGTVKVRTWMDTRISADVIELSKSLTLTTIARASTISAVPSYTFVLGEQYGSADGMNVVWTPRSTSFRYKLKFSMGSWSLETSVIHPNQTSTYAYTVSIPLEAAKQIPNGTQGTMTVTLYTFSDSNGKTQVGSESSKTFPVKVPDNASTKPAVAMALAPVTSLGGKFSSLYIQGKSKVQASLSGEAKFGASISSYRMYVSGESYDAPYLTDYLSTSGTVNVKGRAVDSRGYYNEVPIDITVIPYNKPMILAASGESEVIATRCDGDGNPSDSGTCLLIKAKRSYSPVTSNGVQHNFCEIRYRYKAEGASYSSWITILAGNSLNSDEVVTDALLNGALSPQSTYLVQVQAIDDIGGYSTTTITIPSDKVYMHEAASINSLGIGEYVNDDNMVSIAEDISVRVRGGFLPITIGEGVDLNNLTKPNHYIGTYSNSLTYLHCPISEKATFALEVILFGYDGQTLQRLTVCSQEATVYERQYYSGTWHDWECVNPPLREGVEYRTKERYLGKPVYTKLINFGALPNATNKKVAHGASPSQVIKCIGQMSDSNSIPFHYSSTNWVEIYGGNTYIVILAGDNKSSLSAHAQMWYIKD